MLRGWRTARKSRMQKFKEQKRKEWREERKRNRELKRSLRRYYRRKRAELKKLKKTTHIMVGRAMALKKESGGGLSLGFGT